MKPNDQVVLRVIRVLGAVSVWLALYHLAEILLHFVSWLLLDAAMSTIFFKTIAATQISRVVFYFASGFFLLRRGESVVKMLNVNAKDSGPSIEPQAWSAMNEATLLRAKSHDKY
jgi:hypothetical protein